MHNDKRTKEYLEKWQKVRLSDSARLRIKENLTQYARFHAVKEEGVRISEDNRSIKQAPTMGASYIQKLFNLKPKSMTALILSLALLVGGGTSYAAEGSVPGDVLYPIKVEINENVKSALAISNDAEARLQARLAEERLKEAEELAARGELSAEASANLAARLRAHYEKVEENSDEAETRGDFESSATTRASFEGALRSHMDVLTDLNNRVSGNQGETLITDIRTYADAVAEAQATATVDVSSKVEIENTLKRAANVVSEIKTKLAQAKSNVSTETQARIETRLNLAVEALTQAQASFRAELYQEAYMSAQNAIRIAKEVETMIDSALKLKLEVGGQTNEVLENVIDIGVEVDGNSNGNTDGETGTNTTESKNTEQYDNTTKTETDIEIDANLDTGIIQTDTSVRSNSGLSL